MGHSGDMLSQINIRTSGYRERQESIHRNLIPDALFTYTVAHDAFCEKSQS